PAQGGDAGSALRRRHARPLDPLRAALNGGADRALPATGQADAVVRRYDPAMTTVHERLPVVPAERRAEIAAGPATPGRHAQLLAELPFADAVELQPPRVGTVLGASATVVAWNLERGREVEPAARLLAASGADLALLSELDHG